MQLCLSGFIAILFLLFQRRLFIHYFLFRSFAFLYWSIFLDYDTPVHWSFAFFTDLYRLQPLSSIAVKDPIIQSRIIFMVDLWTIKQPTIVTACPWAAVHVSFPLFRKKTKLNR